MYSFNQPLLCIESLIHESGDEQVCKGEVYRFGRVNSWAHENTVGKTYILLVGSTRYAYPEDCFVPLTEKLMATKLFKLIEKTIV